MTMKKIILLSLLITCVFEGKAQNNLNNTISTSLIRWEKNSQTIYGKFNLKFVAGVEYQRTIKNWNFGVKYEHGLNRINEDCENCADHYYGTGYMRENNFYLTGNYSFAKMFQSKLIFSSGLSIYYSNLNYTGNFSGGFSGFGTRKDDTYNTIGLSPIFNIKYFPIDRLFISLNTNIRFGLSNEYDVVNKQNNKRNEFVINAPELRIGVKF
jgi:hypothetical protein